MAGRAWIGAVATATGVAAGAGAAQLGIGYGLGIITWQQDPPAAPLSAGPWPVSLVWTAFIGATSTVIGAVLADRLAAGSYVDGRRPAWRWLLPLAGALGALITIVLVAAPARAAELPPGTSPALRAGVYAAAGVLAGLILAYATLAARAVAANVVVTASYLWLLTVAALGVDIGRGDHRLGRINLGSLDWWPGGPRLGDIHIADAILMLVAALLLGALGALRGRRRGDSLVGVAMSGVAGPLLVAAAYLMVAPYPTTGQRSVFLLAPYAALVGLLGSLLTATVGRGGPAIEVTGGSEPVATPVGDPEDFSDLAAPGTEFPGRADYHDDFDDAYAPARSYRGSDLDDETARAYVTEDPGEPDPADEEPATVAEKSTAGGERSTAGTDRPKRRR